MTVAAVILAASADSALGEVEGRAAVRRLAETAWSGGAIPIVVVAPERDGQVAAALAGSGAVLAEPAPMSGGPVAQIARGIRVARDTVTETDAALVWPARLVWVDAETVTTLIQAHGLDGTSVLRPSWQGEAGWPVLVPTDHLATLAALPAERMPDELVDDLAAAGARITLLDLGDPGVTHDRDTSRADLPAYEGPLAPLEGPTLAPYEPAGEDD